MVQSEIGLQEIASINARDNDFSRRIGAVLAEDAIRNNAIGVEPPIVPNIETLLENPQVVELVGFAALLGARMTDQVREALDGYLPYHFNFKHVSDIANDIVSRESSWNV